MSSLLSRKLCSWLRRILTHMPILFISNSISIDSPISPNFPNSPKILSDNAQHVYHRLATISQWLLIDIRTKLKTYIRTFPGWSRLANISFSYSIQVIPIVFMRVLYSIFHDRYSIFPIIIKQNVFCFQRLSIPLWPWPLYPAHFFIISQPLSSQRVAFVFLLIRLSRLYRPKTTTSLANLISNCRKSIFSLIPLSNWTRRAESAGR